MLHVQGWRGNMRSYSIVLSESKLIVAVVLCSISYTMDDVFICERGALKLEQLLDQKKEEKGLENCLTLHFLVYLEGKENESLMIGKVQIKQLKVLFYISFRIRLGFTWGQCYFFIYIQILWIDQTPRRVQSFFVFLLLLVFVFLYIMYTFF